MKFKFPKILVLGEIRVIRLPSITLRKCTIHVILRVTTERTETMSKSQTNWGREWSDKKIPM